MPFECVWFDEMPEREDWTPGGCFPTPEGWRVYLSRHYLDHVAQLRPPIEVVLPMRGGGSTHFCIDSHPSNAEETEHWDVTCPWPLVVGEKPLITVAPSINALGAYHGFLRAGVLTDDLG